MLARVMLAAVKSGLTLWLRTNLSLPFLLDLIVMFFTPPTPGGSLIFQGLAKIGSGHWRVLIVRRREESGFRVSSTPLIEAFYENRFESVHTVENIPAVLRHGQKAGV